MKEVYFNPTENTISFAYTKETICIGETNESLENFRQWMEKDWEKRGLNVSFLPKVSCTLVEKH